MVKCKACGADIAKSAKVCPQCGARQKKHVVLGVVLAVFGIGLVLSAVGGSSSKDTPTRVPDSVPVTAQGQAAEDDAAPAASAVPTEAPKSEFGVSEKVELNDINVTLVSVTESEGKNYITPSEGKVFVLCEFEIENNSDKEINVSSMLSFEAYFDDYTATLGLTAVSSADKPTLDGTVGAGKKMNGIIGYEVDANWQKMEIQFTPDFWAGNEIVFVYSK